MAEYRKHINPFIQHVAKGDLTAVEQLVTEYPELIQATDAYQRNPLTVACQKEHVDIVEYLLKHGADVTKRDSAGDCCIHTICRNFVTEKTTDLLDIIVQNRSEQVINETGANLETPLISSIIHSNIKAIKWLLENEAITDLVDASGLSAVHYAAKLNQVTALILLIESGADVNSREENEHGRTPLQLCIQSNGNVETIKLLLENEALVKMEDATGKTGVQYATERGDEAVLDLIKQYIPSVTINKVEESIEENTVEQTNEDTKEDQPIEEQTRTTDIQQQEEYHLPQGAEPIYDRTLVENMLDDSNKKQLRKENTALRIKNEKYLRDHPEIRLLFGKAIEHVLINKPKEQDIEKCLAQFFTQDNLKEIVLVQE
jgi:ankyrin repeat protein